MKEIQLTRGYVALVDDEDYEWLNSFKWSVNISKGGYIRAKRGPTADNNFTKMHRMILGVTDPNVFVDHRDRNALNNCRSNLRIATKGENCSNVTKIKNATSKYLGVCWFKPIKQWSVSIEKNKKKYHLGYFKNEDDAALAYNAKAIELHGEFANLNKLQVKQTA
jgi:hypothetical protein